MGTAIKSNNTFQNVKTVGSSKKLERHKKRSKFKSKKILDFTSGIKKFHKGIKKRGKGYERGIISTVNSEFNINI